MRRRALLMGGKERLPLIILIDTTKAGVTGSNAFRIATQSGLTYSFRVDWGDGTVTSGHTGDAEHTYATSGEKTIKIYGNFPKFYFNNTGDRLKILKIQDWGEINYSTNQDNAFWGCNNLDYIAKDDTNAWYNGIVSASSMFRNCPLTTIPDNMTLDNLVNGSNIFATSIHQGLTSLPDGMTLSNLTNGSNMFYVDSGNGSLTSLPDGMTLASLTNGIFMFYNSSLTSLPDGMVLANLTNGSNMFNNSSLTSLPDGMVLANLTNGDSMFRGNSLTSLPDGMVLANLTSGNQMFNNNNLTSLPSGMILLSLTNGSNMFNNSSLTSLPDGMVLANLTNGSNMFNNNTINTVRYSQLLNDMEALNPNNNVTFNAGNSKYNSSAVTARATLTGAPRNWTITDGGLE